MLRRHETPMTPQREERNFSAMDGMVKRAMTRMSPMTRMMSTTATARTGYQSRSGAL